MLNPLNHHYALENPASVYDEEAMTALELAGRTTAKVNETVKAFNELEQNTNQHLDSQDETIETRMDAQDNAINNIRTKTVPAEVKAECNRLIEAGEFDQAINLYLNNLNSRVDNLLGSVTSGSTTLDAEVLDIRTGNDSLYNDAGTAVREQTKNLYHAITHKTYAITPSGYESYYVFDDVGGIKSYTYTINGATPSHGGVGVPLGRTALQLAGKKVVLIFHEKNNVGDGAQIGPNAYNWADTKPMVKINDYMYEYVVTGAENFGENNLYFQINLNHSLNSNAKFSLYIMDVEERGINIAHRAFYADNAPIPKTVENAVNAGVLMPGNNLTVFKHNCDGSAEYADGKFSMRVDSASATDYFMVGGLDVTDIIKNAKSINIKADGCVSEVHISIHPYYWGQNAIIDLVPGNNDLSGIDWSKYASNTIYLQCGTYAPANLPRTGNLWFDIVGNGKVIATSFIGQENYPTFDDLYAPGTYITCWGDSLTAGGGWTNVLENLSNRALYNGGTGWENARAIMCRQGGDVMLVNNITIPADTTPVQIATYQNGIPTALGKNVKINPEGSHHVNPVSIGGVLGNLSGTGHPFTEPNGSWYFTRLGPGEAVNINRPTAIVTAYDREKNNPHLMVIFIGQNGGYESNAELVKMHRKMIEHSNARHTIILGLASGTASERSEYETLMRNEFGRYFISLREYLSAYGLADAGLTATAEDTTAMSVGQVPPQLFVDGIHFTDACKTVIGNMLYKKCVELNIF